MDGACEDARRLSDALDYRSDRFFLISSVFSRESPEDAVRAAIERAASFADVMEESEERRLGRALSELSCDDMAAFAEKTRTEYARLFVGPRKVLAPLHESAHRSGVSRMFTEETLQVRAFYARHGFEAAKKNREPEDSVGLELEFLGILCRRCAEALNAQDGPDLSSARRLLEAQRSFEEQHALRWMDGFAADVVALDESGYYRAWAAYLRGVLREEPALIDEGMRLLDGIAAGERPRDGACGEEA